MTSDVPSILPPPVTRLVSIRAVAEALGISVGKAWQVVRDDPRAPKPVKLGEFTTRFRSDELQQYIDALSDESRARRERAVSEGNGRGTCPLNG